jgi:hypothetical protein
MRIREAIAEAIAVIALFAVGYGLLLIGHGMGW